jgi:thiol:disulfide interchange protein DsbD
MKKRTRIIVALLAGLGAAVLPSFALGSSAAVEVGLSPKALLLFYVAGLITALTPCVYPLIPITVSIFGAGKAAKSKGRAAALSATYVLGIALMYSGLGLFAAATGKAFGTYLGNPWVASFFAFAMLAMAASMFGAFELALPSSLNEKLSNLAGFGFGSAFLMGLVCGIVAAPCTGPALFGTLTYVAKSGQLWTGFWDLFVYGLGLGTPFFVLGTFAVKLPKSGAWMEGVKTVLGVLLVIVAISFLKPIFFSSVPSVSLTEPMVAVIAGVLVATAIAVGTLDWSFHGGAGEKAAKTFGLVVVIGALAFRFGWLAEWEHSAAAQTPTTITSADGKLFKTAEGKIDWFHDEEEALTQAKALQRPIIIDFFAEWCAACKELDKHTFSDPRVRDILAAKFIPLKVDGTSEDDPKVVALQKKYGVVGLPVVTVVTPEGQQLEDPKVIGYMKADEFLKEIAKVQ